MSLLDLVHATNAELLKLWRRPAFWVLALIVAVLVLLQQYIVSYIVNVVNIPASSPPPPVAIRAYLPDQIVRLVIVPVALEGPYIGVVLGAMLAGGEYSWGTLKMAMTQAPSRLSIYAGRVISLLIAAAVLVLFFFLAGGIGSIAITIVAGYSLVAPSFDLLRGMADSWTILAMWTILGATFATLTRGAVPGIVLGYIWLSAIDSVISALYSLSGITRVIDQAMPLAMTFAIQLSFPPPGQTGNQLAIGNVGGNATLGPWLLLTYLAGLVVVGAIVTWRRDIT
ncbi:MAG: hypothetical protein M3Z66_06785 [Chloroflexota bacterium]|nr:hypothetical protein [Chloroflexota bacterium]